MACEALERYHARHWWPCSQLAVNLLMIVFSKKFKIPLKNFQVNPHLFIQIYHARLNLCYVKVSPEVGSYHWLDARTTNT